jgi:hypothetical protein
MSSSVYKGVSKIAGMNKWIATITFRGRRLNLGRFDEEEDAAVAYDEKAVKLYGGFAKTNFIPDNTDSENEEPKPVKPSKTHSLKRENAVVKKLLRKKSESKSESESESETESESEVEIE